MLYCPCCKEEFVPGEEFCLDCCLPLVEEKPVSHVHLCNCDESPLGKDIAGRFEGRDWRFENEDMDAAAEVFSLTGIRNSDALGVYIDKLLAFNR